MCETEGIPERTKTMFKNTDYGCEVKTILRNDRTMRTGKDYQGTLRLNFRPLPANMSVERYTFGVYCELHKALEGLIEK